MGSRCLPSSPALRRAGVEAAGRKFMGLAGHAEVLTDLEGG